MSYAKQTTVPISRSQEEIRKLIIKYGASEFSFAERADLAALMFQIQGKRIRFLLPLPKLPSKGATQASLKTYEQLCRTKWRCLLLILKAKFESVENNITTIEEEFLAHIVLPSGESVAEVMIPQIQQSYRTGGMPPLLGFNT